MNTSTKSSMPWQSPPKWLGETVFIVAGGPSVRDCDLTGLHHRRVIGVNDAFKLGAWVDVCWSSDAHWLSWNQQALLGFPGLILTCAQGTVPAELNLQRIERAKKTFGLSAQDNAICWNNNSGAGAIDVAVHFGAARIVLIGFDMQASNGQSHWHDYHQRPTPDVLYAKRFLPAFPSIKRDLDALGIDCINCTPNSALRIFPMKSLSEVLSELSV